MNTRQGGLTLIEVLVALVLSMVVVGAMVLLMANSLGTASRIIQMTQLSDELRNTMSMLSRDVRRANYNPYALFCYGNADCGVGADTSVTRSPDLAAVSFSGNTCLRYYLERTEPDGSPGEPISGGAFRHVRSGGVGWVEMWVGGNDVSPAADCSGASTITSAEGIWVPVTNRDFVDITTFTVNVGSLTSTLTLEDGASLLNQFTRQIQVQIEGELLIDRSISRRIEDTIRVRNDFMEVTSI
jgi:type IV pilus assembly protein PilW